MIKAKYAVRLLPFCLIPIIFFFLTGSFCAQEEITELQKQARMYRDEGFRLQKEGDLEGALALYQKAVIIDPKYVVAYNDMGIVFEALGEPEEAKQMYLKATEFDPNYPNSYSNLALLYEEQKDYANAIVCWVRRSVLGGPRDPWAEVARRRLEDIARIYPKAYSEIGEKFKGKLQELSTEKQASSNEWESYDLNTADTPF